MRSSLAFLAVLSLGACAPDSPTAPSAAMRGTQRPSAAVQRPGLRITATDLGSLGGTITNPDAINDEGQVVGHSTTASGHSHAFLWSAATGVRDLGTLGGDLSWAEGINDAGQVVGWSAAATGYHVFLWTAAGGMVDLGKLLASPWLTSIPHDINNAGQVVGEYSVSSGPSDSDPVTRAFLWSATSGAVTLGNLEGIFGGRFTRALDVNGSGLIVGWSQGHYFAQAVLWTAPGQLTNLGALDGSPFGPNVARAINDAGQVAGRSTPGRAFLWSAAAGMRDLGPGEAFGINDAGHVVGEASRRAFLWTEATGMIELPAPPGAVSRAHSINNHGQIVGVVIIGDEWKGTLWTVDFGPATASEAISDLVTVLDRMAEGGELSRGNVEGLRATLLAALKHVDGQRPNAAASVLRAFVREVTAFERSGKVTSVQARELTEGAAVALAFLET